MSISPTEIFAQASKTLRMLPIMVVGLALLFLSKNFPDRVALLSATTGLLIIGISVAVELFTYLQRGKSVLNVSYTDMEVSTYNRINEIELEVASLKNQLSVSEQTLAEKIFSNADKDELKASVLKRLPQLDIKEALSELALELNDEQRQTNLNGLRQLYDGVIRSLDRQITDLGRRANVNLVMGSTITIVGLTVLSYFVFFAVHPPSVQITETTIYFGARLTLVIFIEVFAYFFLRLYRYSLFEIKYFQNEITNARFKIVALETCSREGSKITLDKICMELVKTERNFILKKGETTLYLRRDEIEQMTDSSVTKLIERIMTTRNSADTQA